MTSPSSAAASNADAPHLGAEDEQKAFAAVFARLESATVEDKLYGTQNSNTDVRLVLSLINKVVSFAEKAQQAEKQRAVAGSALNINNNNNNNNDNDSNSKPVLNGSQSSQSDGGVATIQLNERNDGGRVSRTSSSSSVVSASVSSQPSSRTASVSSGKHPEVLTFVEENFISEKEQQVQQQQEQQQEQLNLGTSLAELVDRLLNLSSSAFREGKNGSGGTSTTALSTGVSSNERINRGRHGDEDDDNGENEDEKNDSTAVTLDRFIAVFRVLIAGPVPSHRTSALRVLRYFSHGDKVLKALVESGTLFFVGRSIERDKHSETERMQALKFVRHTLDHGETLVPRTVVRALVAVAESPQDDFSLVCLETLIELALVNPFLAAQCGAMRTILRSTLNPAFVRIQPSIALVLSFLFNDESTRQYMRVEQDLGFLLAPLSADFHSSVGHDAILAGGGPERLTVEPSDKQYQQHTAEVETAWRLSVSFLRNLLGSWPGLIVAASHRVGIRSVVAALRLPSVVLKQTVLDFLFAIFRLESSGDRSATAATPSPGQLDLDFRKDRRHNLVNNFLGAQLLAFLEAGLLEVLVEVAVSTDIRGVNDSAAHRATILLGEILEMAVHLLPPAVCANIQTLPTMLEVATGGSELADMLALKDWHGGIDAPLRSRASAVISQLRAFHHREHERTSHAVRQAFEAVEGASRWRRLGEYNNTGSSPSVVDDVKMLLDFSIDPDKLKTRVAATGVNRFAVKDFMKWRWDLICELIEGPLNNPALVESVLAKTEFARRLLAFVNPANREFFASLRCVEEEPENIKYVRAACLLVDMLAATDIGVALLNETKILYTLGEALREEAWIAHGAPELAGKKLDKSDSASVRIFDQESIQLTLSREYFSLIGTLSSSPVGAKLLEESGVFRVLAALAEHRGDVGMIVLTSLDYSVVPAPSASSDRSLMTSSRDSLFSQRAGENPAQKTARGVLQECLRARSAKLRMLSVRHLRNLLRARLPGFSLWGVRMLMQQLDIDSDAEVRTEAIEVLDEACDEPAALDTLIQCNAHRTLLTRHGEDGCMLALRFLGRPSGFSLLSSEAAADWIEGAPQQSEWNFHAIPPSKRRASVRMVDQKRVNLEFSFVSDELKRWNSELNMQYARDIEQSLSEAFSVKTADQGACELEVRLRPHFFGELARTTGGCRMIADSGLVPQFIAFAFSNDCSVLERRSNLWALGHIGSSVHGFELVAGTAVPPILPERPDAFVAQVVSLAELSLNLSMRGTALFVLGLLAASAPGKQALARCGWACSASSGTDFEKPTIALPKDAGASIFFVIPRGVIDPALFRPSVVETQTLCEADDPVHREILIAVAHLSNAIAAESASSTIKRLHAQHPQLFCDASIYGKVLQLLAAYSYPLQVRRFIYEVFDGVPAASELVSRSQPLTTIAEEHNAETQTDG